MNVLVTGGAGYFGSTLTLQLLIKGHRVRVLDNLMHGGQSLLSVWTHPDFEFRRGDVCDVDTVRDALDDIDAVVHLAAIVGDPACSRHPELARAVNQNASLMLLAESKKIGISRFVFASTCSNYGKMKDPSRYVDESSELRPVSLYAETKVIVERAVLDSAQTQGFCATALRMATVFGVSPRMRFDLTVNEFTLQMVANGHLAVYGKEYWRPYIHVRDAARAVRTVLKSSKEKVCNQAFNVGDTGQNYRKQDLVELIYPYAPEAEVDYILKEEDPRDYRVSFTKINQELGFRISRTVKDGIHEVAKLVRDGIIHDFQDLSLRN